MNEKQIPYTKFETFLSYFMLIISSRAITLYNNYYFLFFSAVFLALFVHSKRRIKNSVYLLPLLIIFIYYFGIYVMYGGVPYITSIIRQVSLILLGLYTSLLLNKKIVFLLEKALYNLILISLVFFFIQLTNFNLLYNVLKNIQDLFGFGISFWHEGTHYANIIIYTINQASTNVMDFRNCGFVFEPGYFSMFINLGIIFNLLINDFKVNKHIIVYLIALITTFSTTGLLAFSVIVFFYMINKKTKYKFILFTLGALLVFNIISSDFVYKKTSDLIENRYSKNSLFEMAQSSDKYAKFSMGRFTGNLFLLKESFDSPFLGHLDNILIENLSVPSSIGPFIFKYGYFLFALLLFAIYKFSYILCSKLYNKKFFIVIFTVILIYLFAFPFIMTVLFWTIFMYPLAMKYN